MLDGLLGGDPQYDATQLPIDEPLVQPPESAPGILLRIRPFKENQGVVDGAGLLQSVHDVTTNFRGKNTSDHHSFEVWFDGEGQILHARRDRGGRRQVPPPRRRQQLRQQRSVPRRRWSCLPRYRPRRVRRWCVAGDGEAPVLPDSSPQQQRRMGDGPYGEITSEMLSLDDSTVVTQVVFRPAKQSWTDGDRFKHNSVDDLARTPARNISWMARSPNAASEPEGQSRPPKPSNSSVASKRSTSTSASSQPPRTRTKPKRVPVGSPGCSESTTTP